MKIFLMAYMRQNLGDDLFIKMLLEKYPDQQFYINIVDDKYKKIIEKYNNITVIEKQIENFEKIDIDAYDGYIYIGGSIFMEGGRVYNLDEQCNSFMKECKRKNKPFFYVSSNFGPYKTQEYFELCRDTFKNCTDLCFRDKYSYSLFKDISSVRYAPDLVFSYEVKKREIQKNTVGISVIDLKERKEKQKENIYDRMLINNIIRYIEAGNRVFLFSFCKEEGDERTIDKIKQMLPEKYSQFVESINYDGDIEKFIEIYQSMEYMICARFHAMILSYVFMQKIYIMSYSKKMDNVIQELNLCDNNGYCKFENIKEDMIINKENFKQVDINNLEKIRNQAQKQLLKIDEWLNIKI